MLARSRLLKVFTKKTLRYIFLRDGKAGVGDFIADTLDMDITTEVPNVQPSTEIAATGQPAIPQLAAPPAHGSQSVVGQNVAPSATSGEADKNLVVRTHHALSQLLRVSFEVAMYEVRKAHHKPPFAKAVMCLRVADLGLVERSNVVLVGTPNGVVKVHCIKRLPKRRKTREFLKSIRGYTWRLSPGDVQNEPGEVPIMVASGLVGPQDELPPLLPREREAEGVFRRAYIRRHVELRKYGFTQGCRGCMAAETGRAPENHSETCRQRIESAMGANEFERARVEVNRRAREEAPPDRHELAALRTSSDDDPDVGVLRVVPRPEPEVRLTPPQETSRRPNGAVKRRTSCFRRSRMSCGHSGQSSVPRLRAAPRRRPRILRSVSWI